MNKPLLTFDQLNTEIGKALKPEPIKPYKSFIDGQEMLLSFPTKRDYLTYLDERDLELVARKS